MTRLNLLLLAVLMGSALLLVTTSYQARHLFAEIERAKAQESQLRADQKRLEAEQQTESTSLKVERVAREKLSMRLAAAENTRYVGDTYVSDTTAAAPVVAAPAQPTSGAAP